MPLQTKLRRLSAEHCENLAKNKLRFVDCKMQWVQLLLITASYVVLCDGFSIPFKRFGGSVSPDVGRNVVRLFILVTSVYTKGSRIISNNIIFRGQF